LLDRASVPAIPIDVGPYLAAVCTALGSLADALLKIEDSVRDVLGTS
jgi:hypothetical protein